MTERKRLREEVTRGEEEKMGQGDDEKWSSNIDHIGTNQQEPLPLLAQPRPYRLGL